MSEHGCGCNDCNRRDFLAAAGLTAGLVAMQSLATDARETDGAPLRRKQSATVRAVFLYPPSQTFKDDPNGWWSWPGNEFDAEGRQTLYTETLRKIAGKFDMTINITGEPISTDKQVQNLANQLRAEKPDGLLLTMFYNRSLGKAERIMQRRNN